MLIAITRRKAGRKLVDREDILTSAVFDRLKYVPPGLFWPRLLAHPRSCAGGSSLGDFTAEHGIDVARYESVTTDIWPRRERVQPDVILRFEGPHQPMLELIIEVKLRAVRGVRGRKDQLARYLRLTRPSSKKAVGAFVYLTPGEPRYSEDLEDAFVRDKRLERYRNRAFHLHWSDVVGAVDDACRRKPAHPYGLLFADLAEYLKFILAAKSISSATPSRKEAPSSVDEMSGGFVINVFAT